MLFFPVIFALVSSFMSNKEILLGKILPSTFNFSNYFAATRSFPFGKFFANSILVSTFGMLSQLLVASMAAYAIVFVPLKNKKIIFGLILASMFIPADSIFIQNYLTIIRGQLLNTRIAMILPSIGTGMGVFLMVQNFRSLPKELIEAARVDGAGYFRIYYKVVLPLSKNVLTSWGMFSFLSLWNMYLWPLMVTTRNDARTVQIGLKMLTSDEANQWGVIMAAVILVILPSLMILFAGQKYIQKNLISGAVKG